MFDGRYKRAVSPESRALAEAAGLPLPNESIAGADAPPYFPEALRDFIFEGVEPEILDTDRPSQ